MGEVGVEGTYYLVEFKCLAFLQVEDVGYEIYKYAHSGEAYETQNKQVLMLL